SRTASMDSSHSWVSIGSGSSRRSSLVWFMGGILARQRWSRPTLQLDPGDLLDVLTRDLISYGRLTLVRHFWNYRIMQTPHALAALSALSHESRLAAFRALVQAGPDGLSVGALRERLDLPAATLTA